METTASHTLGLGEELSIWFKLTPLLRGDPDNPMRILMHMMERYGPVLPVNMAQPTRRAGFGTGILQARARHQGGQLRQIFRRAEAYLRQIDDHQ